MQSRRNRVSTDRQTLAAQDAALHAAGCAKVYGEKQSGANPDCGTLLILVGPVHLCRPRQAVTKLPVTESGGRPPIGEKATTGAEGMRKLRAGRRALTRTV
jgi:hypothetical protein